LVTITPASWATTTLWVMVFPLATWTTISPLPLRVVSLWTSVLWRKVQPTTTPRSVS